MDDHAQQPRITVDEPERMNLLGLMLSSMLERRLTRPDAAKHAGRLDGDVVVDADGMWVTLHFEGGRVLISRQPAKRRIARLSGSLSVLLEAAFGRGRVKNFLCGRLRVGGSPTALWRMLVLVRA
jgi:hypothetical protein